MLRGTQKFSLQQLNVAVPLLRFSAGTYTAISPSISPLDPLFSDPDAHMIERTMGMSCHINVLFVPCSITFSFRHYSSGTERCLGMFLDRVVGATLVDSPLHPGTAVLVVDFSACLFAERPLDSRKSWSLGEDFTGGNVRTPFPIITPPPHNSPYSCPPPPPPFPPSYFSSSQFSPSSSSRSLLVVSSKTAPPSSGCVQISRWGRCCAWLRRDDCWTLARAIERCPMRAEDSLALRRRFQRVCSEHVICPGPHDASEKACRW